MLEKLKGYKVLLFNALSLLVTVAQGIMGKQIIPDEYLLVLITIGNMALRFFTDTPVGKKIV